MDGFSMEIFILFHPDYRQQNNTHKPILDRTQQKPQINRKMFQQLSERFRPYKTQNHSYTYGSRHHNRFNISQAHIYRKILRYNELLYKAAKIDFPTQTLYIEMIISWQGDWKYRRRGGKLQQPDNFKENLKLFLSTWKIKSNT